MKDNGLVLILRAHQLAMEGYTEHFGGKVVTVWSAPDYCDKCGNVGCVLEIDENLEKIYKIFERAPKELREEEDQRNIENMELGHYFT